MDHDAGVFPCTSSTSSELSDSSSIIFSLLAAYLFNSTTRAAAPVWIADEDEILMAKPSSSVPVSSRRTPTITPSVPSSCWDGLRIWGFSSEDKIISFFPYEP
ncbi:Lactamase_B domain-containing protein [Psidium guajava]|nr:Lactamase_B domain-containing protein [Psidium guajava]